MRCKYYVNKMSYVNKMGYVNDMSYGNDMSLFQTKDYSKPKLVKTVYRGRKKQSEENIIKSIRTHFKLKTENEDRI